MRKGKRGKERKVGLDRRKEETEKAGLASLRVEIRTVCKPADFLVGILQYLVHIFESVGIDVAVDD